MLIAYIRYHVMALSRILLKNQFYFHTPIMVLAKRYMSNVIYNHFSNNNGTKVSVLFLDIKKAFNTNIYKLFLDKMEKKVK